eukprot:1830026-Prymnesium_polylepis.1
MATGEPLHSTTAVRGCALVTAATRSSICCGMRMWSRSTASASNAPVSPTSTTATSAEAAAAEASSMSA